jgi:prepilin-type N-terminal cleavage/methylation domain-containing protein
MAILRVNREDRGIGGFSLVELIVVIAITAIVLKISSSMFNSYKQNTNLREAAGALAADMKLAKQRAVGENVNYTITFDINNNLYEIKSPSGCCSTCTTHCTYDVPKKLSNFGAGVKILSQNYGGTMNFYTRGTCDLGTITLQNSLNFKKIVITTNITGRITIGTVTS